MTEVLPFDGLTVERLRRRSGIKWRMHPADVIPAWVAEMDYPLADPVREAIIDAATLGDCGYGDPRTLGPPVTRWLDGMWGWSVAPEAVRPVSQVLTGMMAVLTAATPSGAQVVIDVPAYPPFAHAVSAGGRRPVPVALAETPTGYDLDLAAIEQAYAAGARAHLLCSPHNPTGAVFTPRTLAHLADLAARHDVTVLSDEIYAPLVLDGHHTPFPSVSPAAARHGVAFFSAGKGWNISGLKAAFVVAGGPRMQSLIGQAIGPDLEFQTGHVGVRATIAALDHGGPWLDDVLGTLRRNRSLVAEGVAGDLMGVRWIPPAAGYLAWLDVGAAGLGPDAAETVLERARVALTAGGPFGGPRADDHVRLNFATGGPLLCRILLRMRTCSGAGEASPDGGTVPSLDPITPPSPGTTRCGPRIDPYRHGGDTP